MQAINQKTFHPASFKLKLLAEMKDGWTITQVSKRHGVPRSTIFKWRKHGIARTQYNAYTERDWRPIDELMPFHTDVAISRMPSTPMSQASIWRRRQRMNAPNPSEYCYQSVDAKRLIHAHQMFLITGWTRSPELQADITRWNHAPHI